MPFTPNQEKTLKRLQTTLKQNQVRLTKVRNEILKVIATNLHPTVNDIVSELEKSYPKVNIMSVYNTLDMLLNQHVIYANTFNGKQICYEVKVEESYHLKCDSCGQILHLETFGAFFEPLKKAALNHDWTCDHFKIEVHGNCPDCQKKLK